MINSDLYSGKVWGFKVFCFAHLEKFCYGYSQVFQGLTGLLWV